MASAVVVNCTTGLVSVVVQSPQDITNQTAVQTATTAILTALINKQAKQATATVQVQTFANNVANAASISTQLAQALGLA